MATNNDIWNKLVEVSESVARMEPTVFDLKKAVITGNGVPSLLDRVSKIEKQHEDDCKAREKKSKLFEKWDGRAWAVILLAIGQGITLLFLFLRTGTIH